MRMASSPQSTSAETKKSLYEASTQHSHWGYSPEQLVAVRASLNAAAVSVIRATFEADEVRSLATRLNNATASCSISPNLRPMSSS
jgi:cyclin H